MKVGLIGPNPPPRGGVSMHVSRLAKTLQLHEIAVTIFRAPEAYSKRGRLRRKIKGIIWLMQFIGCPRQDLFHIHVSNWRDRAVICWIARLRKIRTVVTLHSLREDLDKMTHLRAAYVAFVIHHAGYIVTTGEKERDKLCRKYGNLPNLAAVTPFIAPESTDVQLPGVISSFINQHRFIITANGSNMNFSQGVDIYGLDMLVELCSRLSQDYDVGFIYCLTRVTHPAYMQKIRQRIQELGLDDSFLLFCDSIELWPVVLQSQLFVRPTCADSYGVSVAEAITLGVPSIASDVCQRPEGTVLFASRDDDDLFLKVCHVMDDYDAYKSRIQNSRVPECTAEIIRIYRNLLQQC